MRTTVMAPDMAPDGPLLALHPHSTTTARGWAAPSWLAPSWAAVAWQTVHVLCTHVLWSAAWFLRPASLARRLLGWRPEDGAVTGTERRQVEDGAVTGTERRQVEDDAEHVEDEDGDEDDDEDDDEVESRHTGRRAPSRAPGTESVPAVLGTALASTVLGTALVPTVHLTMVPPCARDGAEAAAELSAVELQAVDFEVVVRLSAPQSSSSPSQLSLCIVSDTHGYEVQGGRMPAADVLVHCGDWCNQYGAPPAQREALDLPCMHALSTAPPLPHRYESHPLKGSLAKLDEWLASDR